VFFPSPSTRVSSELEISGDNEIETFNFHNKMASIICRDRRNFRFSTKRAAAPSGGKKQMLLNTLPLTPSPFPSLCCAMRLRRLIYINIIYITQTHTHAVYALHYTILYTKLHYTVRGGSVWETFH